MKVGVFVTKAANSKGFERVASAHVQVPLRTINLLNQAGYEAQLITTKYYEGQSLPAWLKDDTKVNLITDSSKQGSLLAMHGGHKKGVHFFKFIKQLFEIKAIVKQEKLDVLHCFGSTNMILVAGVLKLIGVNKPIAVTCENGTVSQNFKLIKHLVYKKVDAIFTCTEHMKNHLKQNNIRASLVRHGVLRDISEETSKVSHTKNRVLFWRDPSRENGADICLNVFRKLAAKYPIVNFDIAIRPHPKPVLGLDDVTKEFSNINVYSFPYPEGINLADLIGESHCVLLPFRELSINPQFAVIESMLAGKPVITTSIDSNNELIEHGVNGYLFNTNDENEMVDICSKLIENHDYAESIGKKAREKIQIDWNWGNYIPLLIKLYNK
jgi:glycosyltransferase involved in cell wall biosynthesis